MHPSFHPPHRYQVELAALTYQLPRLVRVLAADGRRGAFGGGGGGRGLQLLPGEGGGAGVGGGAGAAVGTQVVSARQRGASGAGALVRACVRQCSRRLKTCLVRPHAFSTCM